MYVCIVSGWLLCHAGIPGNARNFHWHACCCFLNFSFPNNPLWCFTFYKSPCACNHSLPPPNKHNNLPHWLSPSSSLPPTFCSNWLVSSAKYLACSLPSAPVASCRCRLPPHTHTGILLSYPTLDITYLDIE